MRRAMSDDADSHSSWVSSVFGVDPRTYPAPESGGGSDSGGLWNSITSAASGAADAVSSAASSATSAVADAASSVVSTVGDAASAVGSGVVAAGQAVADFDK